MPDERLPDLERLSERHNPDPWETDAVAFMPKPKHGPSTIQQKVPYRDCHICAMTTITDEGRYQARAAIIFLSSGRTLSQRFLDFDAYRTEDEADVRAIEGAKDWVDVQTNCNALGVAIDFSDL